MRRSDSGPVEYDPRGRAWDAQPGTAELGVRHYGPASELDRVKFGQRVLLRAPTATDAGNMIQGQDVPVLQVPHVSHDFRAITIAIDRQSKPLVPAAGDNCDVRCRLRYGLGGVSDTVFMDWSDGGLLTVVADEIEVVAVPFAPSLLTAYQCTVDQGSVSAVVASGSSAGAIPPVFTEALTPVAIGASASFFIPSWARAVSLMCVELNGAGNADLTVNPYQFVTLALTNQAVPFGLIDGPALAGGAAVPLSSADGITVTVLAAAPFDMRVKPVYHLGM